ncbi:thiol-disulfide oxidoreductase ResA [Legionella geestiana]|uniref:Thiol-disulfide oxidoreductase ResA n=2 Tax=Legionella geestiana TaxID=45065 RepID=A0A0W0U5Z8_9GAMM|nr:thiol-disulfide oxidoreductase ResA [Legionella geestiana]STX52948.1 thiol-disulfide oxidoreductase [Legionella geestiana]
MKRILLTGYLMKRLCTLLLATLFSVSFIASAAPLLTDTAGNSVDFAGLRGKWVFVNYWAGWCPGCVDEIPALNRLDADSTSRNIAVFAYHYGPESAMRKKRLAEKHGIRYPSLGRDPAAELGLSPVNGLPVTFVFSPTGQLAETLYGPQTLESLMAVMQADVPAKAAHAPRD